MNPKALRAMLVKEEGLRLHAYQDTEGFWTIGVGRLIDKRRGGGISEAEAMAMLDSDIHSVAVALHHQLPWFQSAPDHIKHALVLMGFQMGIAGLLKFRRTLSLIERGDYHAAARAALKSKWAKQTPARAKRVAALIKGKV